MSHPRNFHSPKQIKVSANYSNPSPMMRTNYTISTINSPLQTSSSGGLGAGAAAATQAAVGLTAIGPVGWTILGVGALVLGGIAIAAMLDD
jgi:hypothetical protein